MIFHVLNGDALTPQFKKTTIEGNIIVMREALVDGDVSQENPEEFYQVRAHHHGSTEEDYRIKVVEELAVLMNAPNHSNINLWFEFDLFCQVNLWFVLSIIKKTSIQKKVTLVYPIHIKKGDDQFWKGFGSADAQDLILCYENRILLSEQELQRGSELWNAYQNNNFDKLLLLAEEETSAFPNLKEVVAAHMERFPIDGSKGKPEMIIEALLKKGVTDFQLMFKEFSKKAGIYGFGDTQVKRLLN